MLGFELLDNCFIDSSSIRRCNGLSSPRRVSSVTQVTWLSGFLLSQRARWCDWKASTLTIQGWGCGVSVIRRQIVPDIADILWWSTDADTGKLSLNVLVHCICLSLPVNDSCKFNANLIVQHFQWLVTMRCKWIFANSPYSLSPSRLLRRQRLVIID